MSIAKTLAIAAALAVGASSFAMAQQGNPAGNAASSGGSGTHQSSQKTGSESNTQKVIKNQNGYRGQQ
jgi:Spy/CpxP family protein refolding chaperone